MSKKAAKKKGPPVVRGKADIKGKAAATKVAKAESLLASQAQQAANPIGKAVATEAAAMQQAHDAVVAGLATRKKIAAMNDDNDKTLGDGVAALDTAVSDYVREGARASNGDPAALASLGITQVAVADRSGGPAGEAVITSVLPGVSTGDAAVKLKRPPGGKAFAVQWKPEPAGPTDVYQPPMGITTSHVECTITGLLPAQPIRVRAMAIGVQPGPWSAEVVGKAR